MSAPYLLESYTAEMERQDEDNSWVTEYDINRERYHAEIADAEREAEIDDDMHYLWRAEELGVGVDFVVDADEEWARQAAVRRAITRYRALSEEVEDPDAIPF